MSPVVVLVALVEPYWLFPMPTVSMQTSSGRPENAAAAQQLVVEYAVLPAGKRSGLPVKTPQMVLFPTPVSPNTKTYAWTEQKKMNKTRKEREGDVDMMPEASEKM